MGSKPNRFFQAKTVGNSLSVPVLNMSRESSDRRHGHRERCDSKEKKAAALWAEVPMARTLKLPKKIGSCLKNIGPGSKSKS